MDEKFTLRAGCWYGWQSIAGLRGAPFDASPIFISAVAPLKTGAGLLRVDFVRLVAPVQSRHESLTVRVVYHARTALIWTVVDGPGADETCLLTNLSNDWVRQHQSVIYARFDPQQLPNFYEPPSIDSYMEQFFGTRPEQIALGAARDSFCLEHGLPEPSCSGVMSFARTFSGIDAWLLLRGAVPLAMEDRWFIYTEWDNPERGRLNILRSWTGYLYWSLPFCIDGQAVFTDRAVVNLDYRQHSFGSRSYELLHLTGVIEGVLLGRRELLHQLSWEPGDERAARTDWEVSRPDDVRI